MEISISTDVLQKKSLFVATPMFGGQCQGLYMKSCLDLQTLLATHGVTVKFSFLFNESLICRARNYLADEFVHRSGCTHMLFIDADIAFDPNDVVALLALDKDISGGPYPKKTIKWTNIAKAYKLKGNSLDERVLPDLIGDYVFNPVHGTDKFTVAEPLEVAELGTGFMMIKREVFEKFEKAYPELRYKPDHVGQQHFDGTRYIHAYFETIIDPDTRRYLSEDYFFTQWSRKIGIKCWMMPWMRLTHIGTYMYQGSLPAIAEYVREI